MRDDELLDRIIDARRHFAHAVVAHHQSGCNDDALLDRVGECEIAYLDAVFTRAERKMAQIRELMETPAAGQA